MHCSRMNERFQQKHPSICVLKESCFENMQKVTGENPCQSVISIKLQSNFK